MPPWVREAPPDDEVARLRIPPHSIEAEQSVLGGLLLDNGAWDRVGDLLTVADFFRHEHGVVYDVIGRLVNACKPADVITVFERIQALGKADDVGGLAYLNALASSVPSAANIRRYAEIVRERSVLRKLVVTADEIATSAFNPQGKSALDLVNDAQAAVMRVAEIGSGVNDDWEGNETGICRVLDHITDVVNGEKQHIYPTGFAALDEKLNGGPRPGELVTIGMRSGMGKSAMAVNIMMNVAATGEPCGMLSMEMPRQQIQTRMLSVRSHIHLTKLKRPERLNDFDWSQLTEAVEFVGKLPIQISDKGGLNINQISARARGLKRKMGKLSVLVVDHLTLTKGTDARTLRTYQLAEVTGGLKSLAKELDCVVYLLVQINRAADARSDSMPVLADIRDTSSVEDDSDIIIFGHREFKAKPDLAEEWRYYAELSIAKQRDGELGRLPMMWVGENVRFETWPAETPVPTSKTRTGAKDL